MPARSPSDAGAPCQISRCPIASLNVSAATALAPPSSVATNAATTVEADCLISTLAQGRLGLTRRSAASHLHQRALGAGWSRAARPGLALGLGRDLFRLGRDRAVEELEAELVQPHLVLHHDDAHVAAALELAEQHLVGER